MKEILTLPTPTTCSHDLKEFLTLIKEKTGIKKLDKVKITRSAMAKAWDREDELHR